MWLRHAFFCVGFIACAVAVVPPDPTADTHYPIEEPAEKAVAIARQVICKAPHHKSASPHDVSIVQMAR